MGSGIIFLKHPTPRPELCQSVCSSDLGGKKDAPMSMWNLFKAFGENNKQSLDIPGMSAQSFAFALPEPPQNKKQKK